MQFDIVVSHTYNCRTEIDGSCYYGIGLNNKVPWHISDDLKHFRKLTTETRNLEKRNAVIMGRLTWQSIPDKYRPLKGRFNVILSRDAGLLNSVDDDIISSSNCTYSSSLPDALDLVSKMDDIENVFIIGGSRAYNEAMNHHNCRYIYATIVEYIGKCDTHIDYYTRKGYKVIKTLKSKTKDEKSGLEYTIYKYQNPNEAEMPYLRLCEKILDGGIRKNDRTGVGTLSVFSEKLEFDLRESFPLLTTKRVYWKGIVHELLWFLSGSTDVRDLQKNNVHIWDGNSRREYLDKIGLSDREEGYLGPIYGFQWRHFGARYLDCHTDYDKQGVDQIKEVIRLIKEDPDSRRMLVCAWNPTDMKLMALSPCHAIFQFYVDTDAGELSCQMYQRSADIFLGVPFNIASYALLTYMIAHVTGLTPGKLSIVFGDTHIYSNHVDQVKKQLSRVPRQFPTLKITRDVSDIDDFKYSDFKLINYTPYPSIKAKMAI